MQSVAQIYEQELVARGFKADEAQLRAVAALDRCVNDWVEFNKKSTSLIKKLFSKPEIPRGVYMYGGVGRGKSFLMDCFFKAVPVERKTRLHFHEFMREVHRELHKLQGVTDPLQELGKKMAQRFQLICFDEFHVSNVTDAAILHRLLEALFSNGVGFVTTSNFKPEELYPNGLHRDRILPAIDLLNQKLEILNVDNGTDYRQRELEQLPTYIFPLGDEAQHKMQAIFDQRTQGETVHDTKQVQIGSRQIAVHKRSDTVVWIDFRELCEKPLSQNDYLELAGMFQTIMVSDIPKMSAAMASMSRRFTLLVDVMYDRHIKLLASAAVPPEELYTEGALAHEFVRTVSRLNEMQSAEYQALKYRHVDSSIT